MKILMMTNSYFPIVGGIEQSIRSFSEEFRRLGHQVLIAAPSADRIPDKEEGVIRVPAIHHFNKTEFSVNLPVPGFASKIMKTFAPDVIHSHHPFFMGDFALRISRQFHVPLVYTYHTMFELYSHYLPFNNEKTKRFVTEIAAGYANLTHQVIAPTSSVRDILWERGVTVPIDIIPTGIDLDKFSKGDRKAFRKKERIPLDAPVAGYVGRLAPEKNLEFLIDSFLAVLKKEPQAHALIVGQGPSADRIRDAFEKAGLTARLHLTGFLYDGELADAYSSMDVFAFTSLSETQGIVILEAMAAGVPVVALDAPGVRDVIKDNVNGRLIDPRDLDKFVEAVLWAWYCPSEQCRNIKHRAFRSVAGYSLDLCAKRMLNIYDALFQRELLHSPHKDNAWQMLTDRIKAEWDLLKNLVEASETAILNEVHPKEGNNHDVEVSTIV